MDEVNLGSLLDSWEEESNSGEGDEGRETEERKTMDIWIDGWPWRSGGSSKKPIPIDYIYIRNLYLADLHDDTDDD